MRAFLAKTVDYAKRSRVLDTALRYNPLYYDKVAELLRAVEKMDLSERRRLTQRLTERTLGWALATNTKVKAGTAYLDWPILDKEQLRGKEESFRNRGVFAVPAATGGTTGVPIRLWRSLRCVAAEQSFMDHILAPMGISFRTARIAILRSDYVKPPSDRRPPFGIQTHNGRRLILSSQHLDDETVEWYANELNEFAPNVFLVKPSSAESLARRIIQLGLEVRVPVILSSTEVLHNSSRRLLAETFQSIVVDQYGLAERTVFALSKKADAYFINPAYGYAEFRQVSDANFPEHLSCAEIITTGFWNESMPLVRYRTGDLIVYPSSYNSNDLEAVALGLKPFLSIVGRSNDYLISPRGGRLVSINHLLRETTNVVRMQIVQESLDRVRIRVIPDSAYGKADRDILMENVRRKIPDDMTVTIEIVDELETVSSGKVPFVIRRV